MSKVEVDTIDTTSSGSGTLTIGSSNSTTITTAKTVTGNFKDIQWQSVITADGSTNTTAEAGKGYFIDTSSATHTINLPASPSIGDTVAITGFSAATNNITIGRNGSNIEGVANDKIIADNYGAVTLVYTDATNGWYRHNNEAPDKFLEATGGTVSTSGDYKIHTFTSSGCFSVSQLSTTSSENEVDYLVVAGGGGGAGGAGNNCGRGGSGAGGFRYSAVTFTSPSCAPGHPLRNTSGITVTASNYPITVGAGGSGGSANNPSSGVTNGSNSVFSTITSTGGGYGSNANSAGGQNGGSGGGSTNTGCVGSGNTPPVSPPQGNNGGQGTGSSPYAAGGGGGAMAVGANQSGSGGNGGVGAGIPNAFGTSGESSGDYYYFSGGGGAGRGYSPSANGTGGTGGGGDGGDSPLSGTAGTANTGGGAGGAGQESGGSAVTGVAGGSGIVIIRYKYQ